MVGCVRETSPLKTPESSWERYLSEPCRFGMTRRQWYALIGGGRWAISSVLIAEGDEAQPRQKPGRKPKAVAARE